MAYCLNSCIRICFPWLRLGTQASGAAAPILGEFPGEIAGAIETQASRRFLNGVSGA